MADRYSQTTKARDLTRGWVDPVVQKILWAAMCSMVQDIHSPQDNLSPEEWAIAERIFQELDEVQNAET